MGIYPAQYYVEPKTNRNIKFKKLEEKQKMFKTSSKMWGTFLKA